VKSDLSEPKGFKTSTASPAKSTRVTA